MKDINVEKILDEIRNEIKEKKLASSDLKFDEIQIKSLDEIAASKFDVSKLNEALHRMNEKSRLDAYYTLPGKGAKLFIKRALRKFVRACFMQNITTQNEFNESVVLCLRQMTLYIKELEDRLENCEEK